MKEYAIEDGKKVDLKKLRAPWMPKEDYIKAHIGLVIPTHDIILEYNGGALLLERVENPGKGTLFPVGGRLERGMSMEDSLRKKVRDECGLEVSGLVHLGWDRQYWRTGEFGHGKGADNLNCMFFGHGKGRIRLDSLHSKAVVIRPEEYTGKLRRTLHPWVRDFMDAAIPLIKKSK